MKRFLIYLVLTCWISTFVYAGQDVPLSRREETRKESKRSLDILPSVTYEANTIRICSWMDLPDTQVVITDAIGMVLYEETVSLYAGQIHVVSLDGLLNDSCEYWIFICTEKEEYYGMFRNE